MSAYETKSMEELRDLERSLEQQYAVCKERKLKLDMSRGKPCPEQLDLSSGLLDAVNSAGGWIARDGTDARNYGGLDGLPETKELFAELLDVRPEEILVGGTSSLTLMHDTVARAMLHGVRGSELPWSRLPKVKFLCPSPGYDRHFAICELFGIEMVVIDLVEGGPDMDRVEALAAEDDSIKGIWCVPKYSNPDGGTYSDETVGRLASMKTKAADFRVFWDDAYTVHHLTDRPDPLRNMLEACKDAGNADRVFIFSSTSKISFSGAGVAVMAASVDNLNTIRKQLSVQTIGPDKLNQLRHVKFFQTKPRVLEHMAMHADILRPKFELILLTLEAELGGKRIATWTKPNGGYFISLNTLDGCAKEVVRLAAEAGVTLTQAGATFPYGHDPRDRNIRIAPSYPSLAELERALEVLCLCVRLVSVKRLLAG